MDYVILLSPCFSSRSTGIRGGKGIHCFYEKPVAVDAPVSARSLNWPKGKEKNLGFMSGFCWRYNYPQREVFSRVLDGAVGDINAMYSTYNAGEVGGNRGAPDPKRSRDPDANWPKHLWLAAILLWSRRCIPSI